MERANVDRWLNDYITAWKTYDPERIGALFSEDVEYRYHPPTTRSSAATRSWRRGSARATTRTRPSATDEGIYDAEYRAVAVEGDTRRGRRGRARTPRDRAGRAEVYDNCSLIRFDAEGRCREFTEWFVKRPEPSSP